MKLEREDLLMSENKKDSLAFNWVNIVCITSIFVMVLVQMLFVWLDKFKTPLQVIIAICSLIAISASGCFVAFLEYKRQ